jgi:muconolactone delta-isomerase
MRIARQHAWAQTVASRGKGPEFWQPYVEEWAHPPIVDVSNRGALQKWLGGWFWMFVVKRGKSETP